jgi:hypothetical protein
MKNKKLALIITLVIGLTFFSSNIKAESSSIGISPAKITINNLLPGLSTTREIIISRSDVSQAQIYVITTDNSESSKWLEFDPGKEINMVQGANRLSVFVTIKVPADAAYQKYSTNLRIVSRDEVSTNQVNIQTGVITNLELIVTDKQIASFKIVSAKIPNYIFGTDLKLQLKIQNDGNVPTAPSRVVLLIKNSNGQEITTLVKTDLQKVDALTTSEEEIAFSGSNLPVGEYLAKLNVLDTDNNSVFDYDLSFRVSIGANIIDTNFDFFNSPYLYFGLIIFGLLLSIFAVYKIIKEKSRESNLE